MTTYRLTLEYDGADFHGWQVQPRLRTVQGELADALARVLGEPVTLTGAGRTDAGVHAFGQVASFSTDVDVPLRRLRRALNGLTGRDLIVREVAPADAGFDARRSATGRVYRYRLGHAPTALDRHRVWVPGYDLDLDAMRAATAQLVGPHDFMSFAASRDASPHKRCEVRRAVFVEEEAGVRLEIEADRFLHHMVRNIVGTLVDVGRGRLETTSIAEILAARDRRVAGPTAPAHALTLWQVRYGGSA
jgi:tRNA pseudouridine38-40 synthase